jgi:hypothetical protein
MKHGRTRRGPDQGQICSHHQNEKECHRSRTRRCSSCAKITALPRPPLDTFGVSRLRTMRRVPTVRRVCMHWHVLYFTGTSRTITLSDSSGEAATTETVCCTMQAFDGARRPRESVPMPFQLYNNSYRAVRGLTEKVREEGHLGFHHIRSDILTQTHIMSHSGLNVEFQAINPEFIVSTLLFAIVTISILRIEASSKLL